MPFDEVQGDGGEVRSFQVIEGTGVMTVTAHVQQLGNDCVVIVWGGTRPHVGAVGMAQVRPSLRDPSQRSASSSVFTYVGHKEDQVAKMMAEEVTRRTGKNTVVVAGIHWDNLPQPNIDTIISLCRGLTDRICALFS